MYWGIRQRYITFFHRQRYYIVVLSHSGEGINILLNMLPDEVYNTESYMIITDSPKGYFVGACVLI